MTTAVITGFILNILPTIAGILLGICYIPQIRQTLKTKNVEGMNMKFWTLLNIAIIFLFINSVSIFIVFGTWGYMLTELFNLVLAFIMLVLVKKYKKKDKENENV